MGNNDKGKSVFDKYFWLKYWGQRLVSGLVGFGIWCLLWQLLKPLYSKWGHLFLAIEPDWLFYFCLSVMWVCAYFFLLHLGGLRPAHVLHPWRWNSPRKLVHKL